MNGLRETLLSRSDDERRDFWAETFGISGSEWMIILALSEADSFTASEDAVAKALRVNRSFVAAHVQLLERNGHIKRSSPDETTTAMLSLSSTARAKLEAAL
jgi:MarR family transcriptional regulator, organic hydroperoxide resistance regulator